MDDKFDEASRYIFKILEETDWNEIGSKDKARRLYILTEELVVLNKTPNADADVVGAKLEESTKLMDDLARCILAHTEKEIRLLKKDLKKY